MIIENNGSVLKKVDEIDIQPDGSFNVPEGITEISHSAFFMDQDSKRLTIRNNDTIGSTFPFYYVNNIEPIKLLRNLIKFFYSASNSINSLQSLILPNSINLIGASAFEGNRNLKNINLSPNITVIKQNTFANCESLETLTIPEQVTKIEGYAFYRCNNLKTITIPDRVTKIGMFAFSRCINLRTITLPANIYQIHYTALDNCRKLELIIINSHDPDAIARMTDLLPESLSEIVVSQEFAQKISNVREQLLKKIISKPNTNPLFRFFNYHGRTMITQKNKVEVVEKNLEKQAGSFPLEILSYINTFSVHDNRFYQKAKKLALNLPLPTNEKELTDYKDKVQEIVNACIEKVDELTTPAALSTATEVPEENLTAPC
ncbi:leucine-rich repeat domain-containing protein [Legionella gresilensis]|uniref:leucine-rich repeat domain-containing protein n=1 Tax=Legionella gresilensis TaxID=91823 RepID=UPI001041B15D|nr:leucine-rich repeat domain-containing protein [Legionella gresilensis]